MKTGNVTALLGLVFSAGLVLAQAPSLTQTPDANANAAQAAPSQPGNNQRGQHNFDPARRAAHMGKQLGLSGDQVAQLQPILADRFQQMQALRNDASLSQQDRRSKAHAIMQDTNTKIEALLNDTQKQQYEQMQANRRNHAHDRQGQAQPQA